MDEIWNTIVAEALERGLQESNAPVPGAKLRQLVVRAAQQRGLEYPPPGLEGASFSAFLKHFDSFLLVLRRPAQDILIAPAGRPDLLSNASVGTAQPQVREDFFAAFTRIPRDTSSKIPWFDPASDRVIWREPGDAAAVEAFVPITPPTFEQAIADRQAFANSAVVAPESRDSLLHALQKGDASALWTFSQALRAAALSKQWHAYRFQLVTTRMREWSEARQLPWREAWLVADRDTNEITRISAAAGRATARDNLRDMLATLDEGDLQRINVPLDIVIKLFNR